MDLLPILSRFATIPCLQIFALIEGPMLTLGPRNPWDIHGKPTDEVGANMAGFALGSIATMGSNSPLVSIPGHLPILGSQLKVVWGFAVGLLVSFAAVHSTLSALAFYASWWNKTQLPTLGEVNVGLVTGEHSN